MSIVNNCVTVVIEQLLINWYCVFFDCIFPVSPLTMLFTWVNSFVLSVGVPMVTMVTQFWAKRPVVSVAHAPVQMGPTVDATLLLLVTRTTVTDKLSATVTRVTQVNLTMLVLSLCLYISSPVLPLPSVLAYCSVSPLHPQQVMLIKSPVCPGVCVSVVTMNYT